MASVKHYIMQSQYGCLPAVVAMMLGLESADSLPCVDADWFHKQKNTGGATQIEDMNRHLSREYGCVLVPALHSSRECWIHTLKYNSSLATAPFAVHMQPKDCPAGHVFLFEPWTDYLFDPDTGFRWEGWNKVEAELSRDYYQPAPYLFGGKGKVLYFATFHLVREFGK